ncbi:MAG: CocE/NonD family hydrolase [Anaerolineae bacterium]
MKKRTALTWLLLGYGAYRYRHSLLARLLKLPAPRHAVSVRRDIPVPMPDGVHLLTDHYAPRSAGHFPIILIRTPYGRGKEVALWGGYALSELPAQRFAERGYHVIVQGARGCYDSEGDFSPHVNEAADGQATVDWITRQPWFNGILGTWGPSYLGYMQWAIAAGAPPALKAMLPMVASSENFTVTHPDGAFGLETRLRWSQGVALQHRMHGRPLLDTLAHYLFGGTERKLQAAFAHLPLLEADTVAAGEPIPFYRDVLTHTHPDDPFWVARDHSAAVPDVAAPVHLVGGWYDYYLRGLLRDYAALKTAGRRPYLTIGPWHHAHPGGMLTGLREGLTWFDAHLKGDRRRLRRKPVRIYVMGADEWRELDDFPPPARETRYYLHAQGRLATDPPAAASPPDSYRYDPADPTPALGGALLSFRGAGPQDNRPLEARSDVLCYTTLPLTRDVEVIGPVRLELFVRSSLPHTDFLGRLCDVAPDGRSTNVCDGLFRIEPGRGEAQPDDIVWIEIDMWATAHRFQRGHRLRLLVSSGAHPRWSRNLGTGEALAAGVRMAGAEQSIYRDEARPSALLLPVVS